MVAFPVCAQLLRTATHLFPAHAPKRRDCVIYSVPHPLLSTNPTDSPDSRISVEALVDLNVSLYLSRKDRYLPLHPQCVRLLPRTHVLAPYGICRQFPHPLSRTRKPPSNTIGLHIRPLGPHQKCTLISRPTAVHHGYIYIESVRRYSCHFTALLPMCIRLT